jgi:hypothetical protein
MGNDSTPAGLQEDEFTESDEWLAAEVRQLFRAHRANDSKSMEVAVYYFYAYLQMTLQRHLRKCDPMWNRTASLLNNSTPRWFDGLYPEPAFPEPGRLRVCGEICWVEEAWYYDPFEFEIELCPKTGVFRAYVMRFGDHRLLSSKVPGSAAAGVPVGGWAYEFERRRYK